ncbi:MAG: GHMP kinase [Sphingobacteriales bacterium]|nr:GHMP kinase [Sphingobacteriales bacterium]
MKTYHAHGKLLLTAEYFILDGAIGLALPTKFGQTLTVQETAGKGILWESIDHEDNLWFEARFSDSLEIISASDNGVAKMLQSILQTSHLSPLTSHLITKLDFPQDWGLGSSSTLISLVAQWSGADPYEILSKTFGGSGYDIACATARQPITFQKFPNLKSHISNPVEYQPSFSNHLYFVHLGRKQNSREGIQHYRNLTVDKTPYIEQISELTCKIIQANELDEFCYYLEVHENILSDALGLEKVKEIRFKDFPGTIKSLGAWGGDFVLAACDESPEKIKHYFSDKGFPTVLTFQEVILT